MPPLPRLNVPSQVIIGAGASDLVGEEAKRLKARQALIVTDPGMARMGLADKVAESLARAGVASVIYDRVNPDPTDVNVAEGVEMLRREGCGLVVGIGGGSALDTAKAVAVMSANAGTIADYMGYHKVPNAGPPVIAIPTTAGTGSEVTKIVVIGDTQRHIKMMCLDLNFLPAAALVDYKLTMSMPRELTANVGLDSLVHAVEAYISRKAQPLTDTLALAAIRQISAHLRTAWAQPDNEAAREAMMLGATLGGMAFSNASVALVHGMSRPLGAMFHLHHGLSNAVLMPTVMRYNAPACPERFADIARAMGCDVEKMGTQRISSEGNSFCPPSHSSPPFPLSPRSHSSPSSPPSPVSLAAAERAVAAMTKLVNDLEVPRLRDCGIARDAFEQALPKMAADALASGSPANNPRVPSAEEITELYRLAY